MLIVLCIIVPSCLAAPTGAPTGAPMGAPTGAPTSCLSNQPYSQIFNACDVQLADGHVDLTCQGNLTNFLAILNCTSVTYGCALTDCESPTTGCNSIGVAQLMTFTGLSACPAQTFATCASACLAGFNISQLPTASPTLSPTPNPTTTESPTTSSPATSNPTTASPTTASPTTSNPTTNAPVTTNSPSTAAPVTSSPNSGSLLASNIFANSGGYATCIVINSSQTLYCTGDSVANFGVFSGEQVTTPAVGLGASFGCATFYNGTTVTSCIGTNVYAQLGAYTNTTTTVLTLSTSVQFPTGKHPVQMAPGTSSTCALLNDGTVGCWGVSHFLLIIIIII